MHYLSPSPSARALWFLGSLSYKQNLEVALALLQDNVESCVASAALPNVLKWTGGIFKRLVRHKPPEVGCPLKKWLAEVGAGWRKDPCMIGDLLMLGETSFAWGLAS